MDWTWGSVSYKSVNYVVPIEFAPSNDKTISHLQIYIFCHFNFCHRINIFCSSPKMFSSLNLQPCWLFIVNFSVDHDLIKIHLFHFTLVELMMLKTRLTILVIFLQNVNAIKIINKRVSHPKGVDLGEKISLSCKSNER